MWPAERVYALVALVVFSALSYLFFAAAAGGIPLSWAALTIGAIYGLGAGFFLFAVLFPRLADRLGDFLT